MPFFKFRARKMRNSRSSTSSTASLPRSCTSVSSASSVSLAFPESSPRKSPPHSRMMEDMVHSTTADSLDLLLQPRLVVDGDPYGLFTADEGKKPAKDEEKKIKALQGRLTRLGITRIKEPQIEYALRAKYADGDAEKAYDFLVLLEDSVEGIIRDYNFNVTLLGAINREKVTCWLDSLLFAMFARLDSFEPILVTHFNDEPRKRLALLLRLWVNMLRSGKLITVDITKLMQEALAGCGWPEAAQLHQQDVSEAFAFVTEQLELPRLTLKMDIYHTGKEDATDDHKVVNERLLQVAIPTEPADGKAVTLEECLENYFNNRVEVRRHLEAKVTAGSIKSCDSVKGYSVHIEPAECAISTSAPSSPMRSPSNPAHPLLLANGRARSSSIIRERYVESASKGPRAGPSARPDSQPRIRRKSVLRKEVLMPAWQFFSLMPWYTDRAPTNDAQVADHFSAQRPVLGICLKRYSMLPNGRAIRLNTYIDIPIEIRLPHFIRDDSDYAEDAQFGNFKLSLQSVVCHRGVSVDAGHYIALVRCRTGDPGAQRGQRSAQPSRDPAREHVADEWIRFDDLARERVTRVDIQRALKEESPYLLFYQVLPVDDADARHKLRSPPPPYSASGQDEAIRPGHVSAPSLGSLGTAADGLPSERTSLDRPRPEELSAAQLSLSGAKQPRISTDETRASSIRDSKYSNGDPSAAAAAALVAAAIPPSSSSPSSSTSSSSFSTFRNGVRASTDIPTATPPAAVPTLPHAKTQADEGRLSMTLSRLTARISRDRLRAGDQGPVTTPDGDAVKNGDTQHRKGKRRAKSKGRGAGDFDPSVRPADYTTPDRDRERECRLM